MKQKSLPSFTPSKVKGVRLVRLPIIRDKRGDLTVGEFGKMIPFMPKRYFIVLGVPNSQVRGEHAHVVCHQFLLAVAGACSVIVDNGRIREEFRLDGPNIGLYIPPMVWATQYKHKPGTVLTVFASHVYQASDYIREYAVYRSRLRSKSRGSS